jgi:hypothetical protein
MFMVFGSWSCAYAGQDPDLTLQAPDVVDVDDPFARGINRIASQAIGSSALPSPLGQVGRSGKSGADLLGQSHDLALLARHYRVVGVAVTHAETEAAIYRASNQQVLEGDKPLLAYLRLGIFDDENGARQMAINLKSVIKSYLGAPFIMRPAEDAKQDETTTILDIGPMHSVQHAERYCELLRSHSQGLITDCYAALEYPGYEPISTFSSSVMLRAAPVAVEHVIKDDGLFNLAASAQHLITLREGDALGHSTMTVVKVTDRGIFVVAENGTVDMLPIDYIPERPYQSPADTDTSPLQPELPSSET